jgi:hypothetical protein
MTETRIHLTPAAFTEAEKPLVEHGPLTASIFRYPSGVCALRIANELGQLILLPFQGQQIWSAEFGGRNLTMKSMFTEPRPTRNYLETYGGFLLHCGVTAMGVPGKGDAHPLHGELPNAPYDVAWLLAGEDHRGRYLALGGAYEHIVAFNAHYVARPEVRLYAAATLFSAEITIENLRPQPMELMYMAHVNFRAVDWGKLVYSAPCVPGKVRPRTDIPTHMKFPDGYAEFLQKLVTHPELHNVLDPSLPINPEIVLFLDYMADAEGWAHSMQVHPDGSADYIAHRPEQLDHGVRWISRPGDQDALGIVLPSTAEPEGYTAEKAKGNIRMLGADGSTKFEVVAGYLAPDEVAPVAERIESILA